MAIDKVLRTIFLRGSWFHPVLAFEPHLDVNQHNPKAFRSLRRILTRSPSSDWTQDTSRSPTLDPYASLSSQSITPCELYLDSSWAHCSVLDQTWHLSEHCTCTCYMSYCSLYLDKSSEAPKQPGCCHASLDSGTSRSSFLVPQHVLILKCCLSKL